MDSFPEKSCCASGWSTEAPFPRFDSACANGSVPGLLQPDLNLWFSSRDGLWARFWGNVRLLKSGSRFRIYRKSEFVSQFLKCL